MAIRKLYTSAESLDYTIEVRMDSRALRVVLNVNGEDAESKSHITMAMEPDVVLELCAELTTIATRAKGAAQIRGGIRRG